MSHKPNNEQLFERSKQLVPGGVHSPVRSFKGLPVGPRFIKKAKGAFLKDVEGKNYVDFCMSFGPLILGHRNEKVEKALHKAIERGWSYGAAEAYSLELAEFIVARIPFVEQLRFVNSGTEAVMTAIRLARGATGHSKIVKFNGCYHGHVDSMLIKAGSGLAGTATASSAGVPEGIAQDTLILELGDVTGLKAVFKQHAKQIAAVIIEPLPANNGLMVQPKEFLQTLRTLTTQHGSLLIFDEVISGFRVAMGGMAEQTGITPDLVTYGKVIGGGLPVGAVAGPKSIMQNLAPIGNVYQAGTLSANPLAMAGGLATLKQMTPSVYEELDQISEKVVTLLTQWLQHYNQGEFKHFNITRHGSLFWLHPGPSVSAINDIPAQLSEGFTPMFMKLLECGIYLAPNAYEVGFVSLAHGSSKAMHELQNRLEKTLK